MDTSIREVSSEAVLEEKKKLRREFKIFDMIFITIAAVIGIDTLGAVSSSGAQVLTWLLISAVTFLLPYGLLTAELGTTFPQEGGVYVWCKLAGGRYFAALASLLYWMSNPLWLGGTLSVTAIIAIATFFYGDPNAQVGGSVLTNTIFRIVVSLFFIWGIILSAILALRVGKWKAASWSGVGNSANGLNDRVLSLRVFDDGSGPALYAGGHFSASSSASLDSIGRWDGTTWSPLGTGMSTGAFVYALEVFDDGTGPALYAGGLFTAAGGTSAANIAEWKNSTWSALGTGLDFTVNVLHVFDDGTGPALYAGGMQGFGPSALPRLMKRNGNAWSALAGGGFGGNGTVIALVVFDDGTGPALYVGGTFATAGGTTVHNVARWNGASWSSLGTGTSSSSDIVQAFAVHDDGSGTALYAGGVFSDVGGTSTPKTQDRRSRV